MDRILKVIKKMRLIFIVPLILMTLGQFLGPDMVLCKGIQDSHMALEFSKGKCCTPNDRLLGGPERRCSFSGNDNCFDIPIEKHFVASREVGESGHLINCQSPLLDTLYHLAGEHLFLWGIRSFNIFSPKDSIVHPLQKHVKTTVLLI